MQCKVVNGISVHVFYNYEGEIIFLKRNVEVTYTFGMQDCFRQYVWRSAITSPLLIVRLQVCQIFYLTYTSARMGLR